MTKLAAKFGQLPRIGQYGRILFYDLSLFGFPQMQGDIDEVQLLCIGGEFRAPFAFIMQPLRRVGPPP